jgi:hypothetical protein
LVAIGGLRGDRRWLFGAAAPLTAGLIGAIIQLTQPSSSGVTTVLSSGLPRLALLYGVIVVAASVTWWDHRRLTRA